MIDEVPPVWADPFATARRNRATALAPTAMRAVRRAVDDGAVSANMAALVADVMTFGDWRADAACRGMNVDVFYPVTGAGLDAAVAVCADCPVRSDCYEWAEQAGELAGVWGGAPADERVRRRSAIGKRASYLFRPTPFGRPNVACIECSAPIGYGDRTRPNERFDACSREHRLQTQAESARRVADRQGWRSTAQKEKRSAQ